MADITVEIANGRLSIVKKRLFIGITLIISFGVEKMSFI